MPLSFSAEPLALRGLKIIQKTAENCEKFAEFASQSRQEPEGE
jgi:hypothetical protein